MGESTENLKRQKAISKSFEGHFSIQYIRMAVNHLRVFSRSLSTSAGRVQLVQPPVQVFGTEGRYATALYSAASKKKSLEVVEKDLKTFQDAMKKDKKFADFMLDPTIKRPLK